MNNSYHQILKCLIGENPELIVQAKAAVAKIANKITLQTKPATASVSIPEKEPSTHSDIDTKTPKLK